MVATIDGKIVSGDREDSVADLGSKTDHQLMQRIADVSDAVLIGASTLRAAAASWSPGAAKRIVVSRSGDLPAESRFFETNAYIATTEIASWKPPHGVELLRAGNSDVDFRVLLRKLKGLGVERLLVLGGSEVNAQLLRDDLIDELFLTVAPKVKLGRDLPTYAGGEALPRDQIQNYKLVEHHAIADELFLRYRRERKV